jgi:hypothetical protein
MAINSIDAVHGDDAVEACIYVTVLVARIDRRPLGTRAVAGEMCPGLCGSEGSCMMGRNAYVPLL